MMTRDVVGFVVVRACKEGAADWGGGNGASHVAELTFCRCTFDAMH